MRLLVALLVAAAVAAPAGAARSPSKLYRTLLTTSFRDLPDSYYNAEVGTDDLDAKDKRHHAVGAALVDIDSGDAYVSYVVYPSKKDVAGRWAEKLSEDSTVKALHVVGKVPGYGFTRSRWINATIEGKNVLGKTVRNGVTILYVQRRNVIVAAATLSTDNDTSGDVPGALRLLKDAIAHLDRLNS